MSTRESVLANKARYRKSHADKIRKDNAAYRATHKKEISEYLSAYRAKNADAIKEARRIYFAKRIKPPRAKDEIKERARRALHAGIKSGAITRPPATMATVSAIRKTGRSRQGMVNR
jgi:hypothetical protein